MIIVGLNGPRRLDISYPSGEFTKNVKQWDGFKESSMGVVIRHIKRYEHRIVCVSLSDMALTIDWRSTALPEYVFGPGERDQVQPLKKLKRSKSKVRDVPRKARYEDTLAASLLSPLMRWIDLIWGFLVLSTIFRLPTFLQTNPTKNRGMCSYILDGSCLFITSIRLADHHFPNHEVRRRHPSTGSTPLGNTQIHQKLMSSNRRYLASRKRSLSPLAAPEEEAANVNLCSLCVLQPALQGEVNRHHVEQSLSSGSTFSLFLFNADSRFPALQSASGK